MIKGIFEKKNNVETVKFSVFKDGVEKMETIPVHPSNYNIISENESIVEFTVVRSWVDLHIVQYAKLA